MAKKKSRVNRADRSRKKRGKFTQQIPARAPKHEPAVKGREARDDPHPLAVAYKRGDIDRAQFVAGDELRTLCAAMEPSTTDSTCMDVGGGGGGMEGWVDAVLAARERFNALCVRTGGPSAANWIICMRFAGEGHPMREAILCAGIPCHRDATKSRIQEALNALAGIKPQWHTPRVKSEPLPKKSVPVFRCANCVAPITDGAVETSELGDFPLCAKCLALEPRLVARPNGKAAAVSRYCRNLNIAPETVDSAPPERGDGKKVARAA